MSCCKSDPCFSYSSTSYYSSPISLSLEPEDPVSAYDKLLQEQSEVLPAIYTGDFIACLLPLAKDLVNAASVVSCNLLNSAGVSVIAWHPVVDLAFGSDFANGKIRPVIPNSLINLLPTGRYTLILRITNSGIQQTFKTYKAVVLAPPI